MTAPDPFIDEGVRARIDAELDRIEREQNVRILLAAESGSRAWRFPSPDSDYDVRFIYVRRLEDYLSIEAPRDVIERPLDAVLDINGWDLRKALQLMMKSNAVLLEWLSSPVRYRCDERAFRRFEELAHAEAQLPALAYHYDRLARGAWAPSTEKAAQIRLKSYFYALRPAFALRWLRERASPPPMDLPSLMVGVDFELEFQNAIASLLALKAGSDEAAMVPRVPVIEAFLAQALRKPADPAKGEWCQNARSKADAVFRRAVLGQETE